MLLQAIAGYDSRDSGSVAEPVPDYRADIESAWQKLGGRPLIVEAFVPFDRELSILKNELAKHLTRYAKVPTDAMKLISIGETKPKLGVKPEEVAAYTLIASTLLNLDETLTRN